MALPWRSAARAPKRTVRPLGRAGLAAPDPARRHGPRHPHPADGPVLGLRTAMPSSGRSPRRRGPDRLRADSARPSGPAHRMSFRSVPASATPGPLPPCPRAWHRRRRRPERRRNGAAAGDPAVGPDQLDGLIKGVRAALPDGAMIGGSAPRAPISARRSMIWTPPVSTALVLGIGFVSCSSSSARADRGGIGARACSRPVAAFGVARLLFQEGYGAGPVRIHLAGIPRRVGAGVLLRADLALAMDYTVFLLASIRERFERTGDVARRRWSVGSRTPAARSTPRLR